MANLKGKSLTIRWFNVMSRTLAGGGEESYPSVEMQSVYFIAPANWVVNIQELKYM